jgi:hypothetical protein
MDSTHPPRLREARDRLKLIRSSLPNTVDAAALHTRAKIPFKVLSVREGYIWRIEELGRCACDSLEKGDVIAAMILARSLTETACALWYLRNLVERQVNSGVQPDLDDVVMRLLMGHKGQPDFPEAMNVLTFIDKADKRFSGLRDAYDHMSECAHPNFWGGVGAFGQTDYEKKVTQFARSARKSTRYQKLVETALLGSLAMTECAYNVIADMMPRFIDRCEEALNADDDRSR